MEDNQLVYFVCLIVAVAGVLLSFFSDEPRMVDGLSPELKGKEVLLKGVIDDKRVSNGHVFLVVDGYTAVIFRSEAEKLGSPYFFLEGDEVVLQGRVDLYKGNLELIVSDVSVC